MRRLFPFALCVACGGGSATGESGDTGAGTTTASQSSDSAATTDAGGSTGAATSVDDSTGGPTPAACDPETLARLPMIDLEPLLYANGDDPSNDPSCTEVHSPERGFYRTMDLRSADAGGLAAVFDEGRRLVYGRVLIDDYQDLPLDDAFFAEVEQGFAAVRDAGLEVIPRVYYADNDVDPDATLTRVLQHIEQLAPVWQTNADVTAVVQAGLVGAWGEWHSSDNMLDDPVSYMQILAALVDAVPAERSIMLRRPSFKQLSFGGPLDAATAHDGSDLSRISHHNDCFLASDDDYGTYAARGEREYMEADAPWTWNGGETCAVNPPRSECDSALAELALLHYSTLNEDYNPDVLQSWQDGGCYAQIDCRLGHRLLVTAVRAPTQAAAGETIAVEIAVFNDGWAGLQNARPLAVVLTGPQEIRTELAVDPRTFMPGEQSAFCAEIALPAATPAGDYELALHIPHASESLSHRSEYAVRVANAEWDGATGHNVLPVAIAVE
jgi:hypothetical protein